MLLVLVIFFMSVLLYFFFKEEKKITLDSNHCLITGGSSGIGLALAVEAAKSGANVTIIARSQKKLEDAKMVVSLTMKSSSQKVLIFSADICGQENNLEEIISEAEKQAGPITLLINCAGASVCYPFLDTPVEDFSKMMGVNYFGSIHMTRTVLPLMKERRKGKVVFVSSLAGLMGLYGYTAYSASKFALLGMAESLQMEMKPYNISITVAFPSDTDTPGFAEEIKNKPIETMRISESGGLLSPEKVAVKIIRDVLKSKFISAVGLEGWLLSTMCSGMTPINSYLELAVQVSTMGLLRLVGVGLLFHFDHIVKKCAIEKEREKLK